MQGLMRRIWMFGISFLLNAHKLKSKISFFENLLFSV